MSVAEQLEGLRRDFSDALAGVERLAAAATDAQWVARPRSGGWSAAECIAHLTLTNRAYLPLFDAARAVIPAGAAVPGRYRRSLGGWLLEWSQEPPARSRFKTIPAFIPEAAAPKDVTVAAFAASQDALLKWVGQGERVPFNLMTITSPFNQRLKYNAYSALRVLASHQRRHLWQAERAVRGEP
jgi:hypothetical protein